jgi:hypothetical protein
MYGEADVIGITKANLSVEYEIKLSKSDFKADFKKTAKHLRLSGVRHRRKGYNGVPNRFYYVTPVGLLGLDVIPPYAGLIEINTSAPLHVSANIVKKAPLIHSDKANEALIAQIAHALTIRLVYGGSYVKWLEQQSVESLGLEVDRPGINYGEFDIVLSKGSFGHNFSLTELNEAKEFFKNM